MLFTIKAEVNKTWINLPNLAVWYRKHFIAVLVGFQGLEYTKLLVQLTNFNSWNNIQTSLLDSILDTVYILSIHPDEVYSVELVRKHSS